MVLIDVMVIESARSALNTEHHQLLKLPPGELVTINNIIPARFSIRNILADKKPKNGSTMKCMKTPVEIAFVLRTCITRELLSTVWQTYPAPT
jgi:hypothetical protein